MCEFNVYLDGNEESNIVARRIIKAKIKDDHITMIDASGKSFVVKNVSILTVDTIMTEIILRTNT